jgi:hypothetical protein
MLVVGHFFSLACRSLFRKIRAPKLWPKQQKTRLPVALAAGKYDLAKFGFLVDQLLLATGHTRTTDTDVRSAIGVD